MPAPLSGGVLMPADGSLPSAAVAGVGARGFGIYVHVPFCATRCGYCDFNTYTATELGGASRDSYPDLAVAEIRFARRVLGDADIPVSTVFFGGGTPTLLPPSRLGAILDAVDGEFGLAPGAEVSVEANPESVDDRALAELRAGGVTRMSFGMQSVVSDVLAVLDRVHSPGRPARCVTWARAVGFAHVNLDLIYGAPGESDADWCASLDAAVAAGPDHISAYALTVEDGTALAARIRRGELPAVDDDALADRYLIADEALGAAGMAWYEVSNWAAGEAGRCAHNRLYWTGGDWWGVGPGAHSHVGGTRWWNVKHPAAYASRLAAGRSPAQAGETLTPQQRSVERVLLTTRLAEGCPLTEIPPNRRGAAWQAAQDGLVAPAALAADRIVLTRRGRLLADSVIRDLLD